MADHRMAVTWRSAVDIVVRAFLCQADQNRILALPYPVEHQAFWQVLADLGVTQECLNGSYGRRPVSTESTRSPGRARVFSWRPHLQLTLRSQCEMLRSLHRPGVPPASERLGRGHRASGGHGWLSCSTTGASCSLMAVPSPPITAVGPTSWLRPPEGQR
jgi:hypothetical protein